MTSYVTNYIAINQDGSRKYAIVDDLYYKFENGTWGHILNPILLRQLSSITTDATGQYVYLTGHTRMIQSVHNVLYRSNDYGITFTALGLPFQDALTNSINGFYVMVNKNNTYLYLFYNQVDIGKIYVYDILNPSWTTLFTEPNQDNLGMYSAISDDGSYVYCSNKIGKKTNPLENGSCSCTVYSLHNGVLTTPTFTTNASTESTSANVLYNSGHAYCSGIATSSSGQYVYMCVVNVLNDAGASRGIFRSADHGATWTNVYPIQKNWSGIGTDSTGQYVYAVVNDAPDTGTEVDLNTRGNLYFSRDYGETFITITNNSIPIEEYFFSVSVSSDGRTITGFYKDIGTPTPNTALDSQELYLNPSLNIYSYNIDEMAVDSYQPNYIAVNQDGSRKYAIVDDLYYKFENGTWTLIPNPSLPNPHIFYLWTSITTDATGQYVYATMCDYAYSYGFLYKSNDYGVTFTEMSLPVKIDSINVQNGFHVTVNKNNTYLYLFNNYATGRIYVYDILNPSWTTLFTEPNDDNLGMYSAISDDGSYVYCSNKIGKKTNPLENGSCSCTVYSLHNGVLTTPTFTTNASNTNTNANVLYNSGHAYCSGIATSSSGQYVYMCVVNVLNDAGASRGIFRSADYGATWTNVSPIQKNWSGIGTDSTGQYVYAVVNDAPDTGTEVDLNTRGNLYFSRNYGKSFYFIKQAGIPIEECFFSVSVSSDGRTITGFYKDMGTPTPNSALDSQELYINPSLNIYQYTNYHVI